MPCAICCRLETSEDSDTVVSEIVDCDTKSLPDVIPSTVLESVSSNSTNCDITANLVSVDMDTSMESNPDKPESEMDLTEEVETQTGLVHVDQEHSVEEKRATHYLSNETSWTSTTTSNDNAQSDANNSNDSVGENNVEDSSVDTPKETELLEKEVTEPVPSSEVKESENNDEEVHIHLDNSSDFDSFQYWRTPLPQVDVDLDVLNDDPANETMVSGASEMYGDGLDLSAALSNSLSDLTVCDNNAAFMALCGNTELDLSGTDNSTHQSFITSPVDGMVQGRQSKMKQLQLQLYILF